MLDIAEPSIEHDVPRLGKDTALYTNGSIVPIIQSGAVILNGSEVITRSPTPRSRDESLAPSSKRVKDRSEDPSGLAGQVHSILSIDSPPNGTPAPEPASSHHIDEHIPKVHQLQVAMLPTGLCYDVRMRFHCELQPHQRPDDHHPEDPRRIYEIYKTLCQAGLVDDPMSTRPLVPQPLARVMARNATPEEICMVHDARHYAFMESLRSGCAFLSPLMPLTDAAQIPPRQNY